MQNNPIMQMVQAFNGGGNPLQLLGSMAGADPRIGQAMQMMRGKNAQQLQQMAQNLAANSGINLPNMIKSLGLNVSGGAHPNK